MSSIFTDEVEICKDGAALGIMYFCSTFLIKTQRMQNGVTVVLKGRGGGGFSCGDLNERHRWSVTGEREKGKAA